MIHPSDGADEMDDTRARSRLLATEHREEM